MSNLQLFGHLKINAVCVKKSIPINYPEHYLQQTTHTTLFNIFVNMPVCTNLGFMISASYLAVQEANVQRVNSIVYINRNTHKNNLRKYNLESNISNYALIHPAFIFFVCLFQMSQQKQILNLSPYYSNTLNVIKQIEHRS